MGKGDRRSRKGKIRIGSYGNSRRRKESKFRFIPKPKAKPVFAEVKETVEPLKVAAAITNLPDEHALSVESETTTTVVTPKKTTVKKTAVKKTTAKSAAVKKAVVKKTTVKKVPAVKKSATKK